MRLVDCAGAAMNAADGVAAVLALACEGLIAVDIARPILPETQVRRRRLPLRRSVRLLTLAPAASRKSLPVRVALDGFVEQRAHDGAHRVRSLPLLELGLDFLADQGAVVAALEVRRHLRLEQAHERTLDGGDPLVARRFEQASGEIEHIGFERQDFRLKLPFASRIQARGT